MKTERPYLTALSAGTPLAWTGRFSSLSNVQGSPALKLLLALPQCGILPALLFISVLRWLFSANQLFPAPITEYLPAIAVMHFLLSGRVSQVFKPKRSVHKQITVTTQRWMLLISPPE